MFRRWHLGTPSAILPHVLTMDDILVEPPGDGEVLDPSVWFGEAGTIELEIGCGKGGFLLDRARSHPHVRLLGIEWANKYCRYGADRIVRAKVENVRVMRTDAQYLVMHHLAPDTLSALHVYHPDPWPKKRHHKRRLFQPGFVEAALRVTQSGGHWYLQSDHAGYFEWITEMLRARSELAPFDWDGPESLTGDTWSGTNFEIKYVREGRPIYRRAYRVQ